VRRLKIAALAAICDRRNPPAARAPMPCIGENGRLAQGERSHATRDPRGVREYLLGALPRTSFRAPAALIISRNAGLDSPCASPPISKCTTTGFPALVSFPGHGRSPLQSLPRRRESTPLTTSFTGISHEIGTTCNPKGRLESVSHRVHGGQIISDHRDHGEDLGFSPCSL
jgi:hypothetical protein